MVTIANLTIANLTIANLEFCQSESEEIVDILGGTYANADTVAGAAPGQGYAGAIAAAQGNRTTSLTDTSVKIYDSGTSAITDASAKAYAYAQTGNHSSRSYSDSVGYSVHN